MRTSTCPGPGVGTGTSTCLTVLLPGSCTPRMVNARRETSMGSTLLHVSPWRLGSHGRRGGSGHEKALSPHLSRSGPFVPWSG